MNGNPETQKPKTDTSPNNTAVPGANIPLLPNFPQQGYSISLIPPAVPPHVWTQDNFNSFMNLLAQEGNHIRSINDKQSSRDFQLKLGILIGAGLLVAFGCYLIVKDNLMGEKIIWGTLGFIAGILTGSNWRSFSAQGK